MTLNTTAYASPQDVFDLLNITDPVTFKPMQPDNTTFPTYDQLQRRLLGASDDFDRKTHDTWRVNYVQDFVFDRGTLWSMSNMGVRSAPVFMGGWPTQLIGPILTWDTTKDKLELRVPGSAGEWTDISDMLGSSFWFDYEGGVFYYLQSYAPINAAFRISYRYGRDTTPPYDIQDAVCKNVAIWVMQSDWYRARIGGGGDLQAKGETIRSWRTDIDMTILENMNSGTAVSLLP